MQNTRNRSEFSANIALQKALSERRAIKAKRPTAKPIAKDSVFSRIANIFS